MPAENLFGSLKIPLWHFMAGRERAAENSVHQVSVKSPTEKVTPMTIILPVDRLAVFARESFF